jgi:coenzyme Q-binding protein COQ10
MLSHRETQFSPYSPEQLFDLVADIEKYPQFLPWCRAARVIERKEGEMLAELIISFMHLTERYTSRVVLNRPHSIDVNMTEGPFEHLVNQWRFKPKDGGTEIEFFIDFKFRSRILEKMIGPLFSKATDKMTTAFQARARQIYGAAHG